MDEAMNPLYILGVPLGYVMEWIYKLIPNYGWDIILFTLLINIVKTPLQLNQQKNTVRMSAFQPMIAAQNAIGYDVYVTGNHEYNYGMATLEKVLSQQKAKVLTGNVYSPEGKPLADGYTIIHKGGVKIGVIGMVTPNITRWDAKNLEGWTVTNPVDESRKIIDQIKGYAHGRGERVWCLWLRCYRPGQCLPGVRCHRGSPRPQEHPQPDDQQRAGGGEQERGRYRV